MTTIVPNLVDLYVASRRELGGWGTRCLPAGRHNLRGRCVAGNTSIADGSTRVSSFKSDQTDTETTTAYDSFGRGLVVSTTDGSGTTAAAVTVNTYDNAGREIAVQSGVGSVTQYTLDSVGNTVVTTDPLGNVTRSVFDLDGNVIDSFDATGAMTQTVYNNRGWATSDTDAMGNTSYTTYDHVGNVLTTEDGLTHVTTNTYNGDNELATVTDPMLHVTTYAYNGDGQVIKVTDPRSDVTSTTYDYSSNEIITTEAYGTAVAETTTQTLDADGNVVEETNGDGGATTYTLNADEQATAITNPQSDTTTTTLNKDGVPTAVENANGKTTTYTLNALGQQTAVTDPTSLTTHYVLNANGATVATMDSGGNTSYSDYNQAGAGTVSIDADGDQSTTQFNAAGLEVAFTDPDNNTTMWAYDRNGNKVEEFDPNGGTVSWSYNAVNQVTATTDQLGREETYNYNNDGNLTTELWKNSGGTTVNTLTYSYDADGNMLTAGDSSGTYTMTYDALNRVASREDVWGLSLTFTYDTDNNLTSQTDSLGGTQTFTYNTADQLTDIAFTDISSDALSVNYTYTPAGQVSETKRYSDATETTLIGKTDDTYDYAGRVTAIDHKNAGGTAIDDLTYTYNSAGEVATESSSIGSSATLSYDPAGQLTGDGTNTYKFDPNGNPANTGDTVGTDNELTSDGTWNYSYDLAGNMTEKVNISTGEIWTYGYDNANQLVQAQHEASSISPVNIEVDYTYDVFGNMISETDYPTGPLNPSTTTREAYDLLGNAWADLTTSDVLITRRLYADGVDLLLARIDSNGIAWYLTDNLCSVRDITSSSGSLLDHRDYSVWGEITNETAPSYGDRYGWTGREFDVETGLQFNRARWYDPSTGRWDSQDPLGFGAGDSNLYRYVRNQPANGIDPSGEEVVLILRNVNTGGSGIGYHVTILWTDGQQWVTFDGSGPDKRNPNDPTRPQPVRNPPKGTHPAPPPGGGWSVVTSKYKTAQEELAALDNAFRNLNQLPYNVLSANSNTYAHQLLNLGGFTVQDQYLTQVMAAGEGNSMPRPNPIAPTGKETNVAPLIKTSFFYTIIPAKVGPTTVQGWNSAPYGGPNYDRNGNNKPGPQPDPGRNRIPGIDPFIG